MGARGPKPKPIKISELSGRSHHKKEPPPVTLEIDNAPQSDYEYIPNAKELWDSLSMAGIVKTSDRLAYLRYSQLQKIYFDAVADIKDRGMIINKDMSNERYNPSWRIMRDAQAELLRLESEFGLTPSSKRRVLQPLESKTEDGDDYGAMRQSQRKEREAKRE